MAAAAIRASHVPFSDAALLVPLQSTMVSTLLFIWGVNKKDVAKICSLSTVCQTGVTLAGLGLASLLKCIPGIGTVIGAAINAIIASVLTAGLGVGYLLALKYTWQHRITEGNMENVLPFEILSGALLKEFSRARMQAHLNHFRTVGVSEANLFTYVMN